MDCFILPRFPVKSKQTLKQKVTVYEHFLSSQTVWSYISLKMDLKFTHKYIVKRPYQKYWKDRELVKEVFNVFITQSENDYTLKEISQKTNIPIPVLSKWRKKFKQDQSYRPGNYGIHNRLFTDAQEAAFAEFLRIQNIATGRMVKRKHLRKILHDLWVSIDPITRQNSKSLFSYHFLKDFCKRNGLSFRQLRKKKRSDINEDEVIKYSYEYMEAFSQYPWRQIVNMDETNWQYNNLIGKVLAKVGDETVQASLPNDYRKNFSCIATIAADGHKFPPIFIAKGTTNRCHAQFENMESEDSDCIIAHSKSGFTLKCDDCLLRAIIIMDEPRALRTDFGSLSIT